MGREMGSICENRGKDVGREGDVSKREINKILFNV